MILGLTVISHCRKLKSRYQKGNIMLKSQFIDMLEGTIWTQMRV